MKPVFQEFVDLGRGDCMRACLASILELELCQVPHFTLFPRYFDVFWHFIRSLGHNYQGCGYPNELFALYKTHPEECILDVKDSINGYFYGVVPSRTFENVTHAVVLDKYGIVVHDPNPNQKWLNVNTIETKELEYWFLFGPWDKTI